MNPMQLRILPKPTTTTRRRLYPATETDRFRVTGAHAVSETMQQDVPSCRHRDA